MWIIISMMVFGAPLLPWLILNIILTVLLLATLKTFWPDHAYDENNRPPMAPGWLCALYTFSTSMLGYVMMRDFYFP